MLRFRRSRLFIGIEPRKLTLVRLDGKWRTTVGDAEEFPVPADANDAFTLQILAGELKSQRWRGLPVQVTLADSLTRYFIVTLPRGVRNLREVRDAAVLRFGEIFGGDAKDWTTAVDLAALASHHLGCACRTNWVNGLQRICREANTALDGIRPFGVSEFNRNQHRIGYRSGWFAALGPDTLWTAFKSGNGWLASYVHRLQADMLIDLPGLIARAQLRAGIDERLGRGLWLSGQVSDVQPLSWTGEEGKRLLGALSWPGRDSAWSRTFRLALSPMWPSCV